ncbi:hypothetical protein H2200_005663 [Cladophialophora chaetospira]|uniref:Uncharacterized protein n=1 Tax=Cladophialophora chaetospira TaxID=386627 RepID=A0AA38X9N4_9EURO|nr:hypothetical protein H2200_005663 [Cladophialophora chaetospira]
MSSHAKGKQAKTLFKDDQFLAVLVNQFTLEDITEASQTPKLFLRVLINVDNPLAGRAPLAILIGQNIVGQRLGITDRSDVFEEAGQQDLRAHHLPINAFFLQKPARALSSTIPAARMRDSRNIRSET